MLKETERAKGGGDTRHVAPVEGIDRCNSTPTLAELGISKYESANAQVLADVPEEDFAKVVAGKKTVTQARLVTDGYQRVGDYAESYIEAAGPDGPDLRALR